ncbi:hypothetical protein [Nostoc sp.]|uniref:hypothetical protein n=1 Tax=Nostoc sp. TaxID=1180 RepID=UPI002FFD013A
MLKETIEELRNEHGGYYLSTIKKWAVDNAIDYLYKPLTVLARKDYIAVFPRSHNPTNQVFIRKGNETVEISAI